jgi:WD40 repeat protein
MDGTVMVWDLEPLMDAQGADTPAPPCLECIPSHPSGVTCIELIDDAFLCTGGWDAEIRVHDLLATPPGTVPAGASRGEPLVLRGHSEFVRALAGADGLLFSASNDRTVRVWDLHRGGSCISLMTGHTLPVICLAICEGLVFSAGYDFVIKARAPCLPAAPCVRSQPHGKS